VDCAERKRQLEKQLPRRRVQKKRKMLLRDERDGNTKEQKGFG
jgi:hypothetical protein